MANVNFDAPSGSENSVLQWRNRLADAMKQEKEFRKDGTAVTKLYEEGKDGAVCAPFNILYSNTETLSPALYNNQPRPVVERRFKDEDPVGKEASVVMKRILEYLLDSNDQDYSNFDAMMRQATLEALLPGRGVTRFKYDAEVEEDPSGQPSAIRKEYVCGEEVAWNRVLFGYAKRWVQVPWMAIEHFMDAAELEKNFNLKKDQLKEIPLTVRSGEESDEKESDMPKKASDEASDVLFARVWEIWDKSTKKVYFIADGYGEYLRETDDPLGLSGFFPIPKPLALFPKISTLTPTALYKMYEAQAEELNIITVRIKKITLAMKVRGFYDSTLTGLDTLLSSEDNTLIPAENAAAMLQGQTLDKAIMLMPIEKLVTVLNQLVAQREQVKQVIYEITGISDILRGASAASETATAQNIKNQWGTLRLKRLQKEVQRYVRDCLRIMAEIAVSKLSPGTIAAMTGLNYPSAAMKQQAQAMMPQLQAAGQQPPPDMVEMLKKPTWEDILGLLQNDLQRNYRIDIETNSTVDADATEDKDDVAEVMNAIAQFMNGIAPMLEQGYMTFDVAKLLLLSIIRRFRFGNDIEDQIKAMQAPPPKTDPKVEGEKQKLELEKQRSTMELTQKQQEGEMDLQLKRAEMELKQEELEIKREELMMKREALQMQRQAAMQNQILTQTQQANELEHSAATHNQSMQQLADQQAAQEATAASASTKGEE